MIYRIMQSSNHGKETTMSTYNIIDITTSRLVGQVQAKSERAAILRAHKLFGWGQWNRAYLA